MEIKDLKTLVKMITETDITEFEMENADEKIVIKRVPPQNPDYEFVESNVDLIASLETPFGRPYRIFRVDELGEEIARFLLLTVVAVAHEVDVQIPVAVEVGPAAGHRRRVGDELARGHVREAERSVLAQQPIRRPGPRRRGKRRVARKAPTISNRSLLPCTTTTTSTSISRRAC